MFIFSIKISLCNYAIDNKTKKSTFLKISNEDIGQIKVGNIHQINLIEKTFMK